MNIFNNGLTSPEGKETFLQLVQIDTTRIELIRSCSFKNGAWYDQEDYEWVVLLQGHATLAFEDKRIHLQSGDTLEITPHQKHRVLETSEDALWLAVHINS